MRKITTGVKCGQVRVLLEEGTLAKYLCYVKYNHYFASLMETFSCTFSNHGNLLFCSFVGDRVLQKHGV